MLDELEEQIQMAGSLGKVSHTPFFMRSRPEMFRLSELKVLLLYGGSLYHEIQSIVPLMRARELA